MRGPHELGRLHPLARLQALYDDTYRLLRERVIDEADACARAASHTCVDAAGTLWGLDAHRRFWCVDIRGWRTDDADPGSYAAAAPEVPVFDVGPPVCLTDLYWTPALDPQMSSTSWWHHPETVNETPAPAPARRSLGALLVASVVGAVLLVGSGAAAVLPSAPEVRAASRVHDVPPSARPLLAACPISPSPTCPDTASWWWSPQRPT